MHYTSYATILVLLMGYTYNSVVNYQRANNLDADGIIGPNTKKLLFNSNNNSQNNTSTTDLPC